MVWAPSRQNKLLKIPISLVKSPHVKGPMHVLVIAYGAYGGFQDPSFNPDFFPLLDRGIAIAICHPRGDADLGTDWYLNGKGVHKENTFLDVGDCMHHLIQKGITSPGLIALKARSAGGLLAGYVINHYGWIPSMIQRDDAMVKVVIAQVPFIDPIRDMLNASIPWTPFEYFEWGNPIQDQVLFKAMLQYSPYENIRPRPLPAILVTAGIQDSRVPYWEPTKYVAKLRAHHQNAWNCHRPSTDTPLLLRVRQWGHFAGTDEQSRIEETAEWQLFLLWQFNRYE
jgi:oligopeptidase B